MTVAVLSSTSLAMPSTNGPSALILIADGTEEMELYAVLVVTVSASAHHYSLQHNNL
jgi:hypothetical protein